MDFAAPADYKVKIEESENINKYFNFTKNPKTKQRKNKTKKTKNNKSNKLWSMGMTVIPMFFGALGTLPKGLERRLEYLEIRRRIETIRTLAQLKSARILRRVLETWGDLLSLKLRQEHNS